MDYGSTKLPPKFWTKVEIGPDGFHSQTGENLGPCWIWIAGIDGNGYGSWGGSIGDKIVVRAAHRWAYLVLIGDVPIGLELDHLCEIKLCCNPTHLEPVSHAVNCRRGKASVINGGRQRSKTHCKYGHAFDDRNTRVTVSGRRCRKCGAIRAANLRRSGFVASKRSRSRTHCRYGHAFDVRNPYTDRLGYPICRLCRRHAYERRRSKKRDAGLVQSRS